MRDSSRVTTRHNRKGRFPTPGFLGARVANRRPTRSRARSVAPRTSRRRACVSVRACARSCVVLARVEDAVRVFVVRSVDWLAASVEDRSRVDALTVVRRRVGDDESRV